MNKGIVFYSSFIPNKEGLQKGIDFLEAFEEQFSDYILFIGIQKDSLLEWEKTLNIFNKNNNIFYEKASPDLYVNSDVSGFQKALELYYKNIDHIILEPEACAWFGHSKGVTTNNNSYHYWCINNFWKQRDIIENRLNSDSNLGCFGKHLSYIPNYSQSTNISNIWTNYAPCNFIKRPLNFMFVNTFFVIKHHILKTMLEKIDSSFFNSKIVGAYGEGDRYFFERDFIHFVDMMGYEPLFEEISPNHLWPFPNVQEWLNEINSWKFLEK